MKICWLSAGVSSFIAGWLERQTVDKYIYINVEDQHPDSMRFIKDCEKVLGKPIEILESEYKTVGNVCRMFRFVNSPYGAKCTDVLKKRVRKKWEHEHQGGKLIYVWGMDVNEKRRADRIRETMTDFEHCFPLIDRQLSKDDCHAMLRTLGIKRPEMYNLGYNNNNCIGCVKGGKGYWNKIRVDFPDVFADRARMEREIGHSIIKGVYLDELNPEDGRMSEEVLEECSVFCMIAEKEL